MKKWDNIQNRLWNLRVNSEEKNEIFEIFKDEISFSLEYSALAVAPGSNQLRSNMLVNKTSSSSSFARKQNLSSSTTLDNLSSSLEPSSSSSSSSSLEPSSKSLGLSSLAPDAWAGLVTRLDKGEQEWEDFYRWKHLWKFENLPKKFYLCQKLFAISSLQILKKIF